MGPSRSSPLRIGDDFSIVVGSGQVRDAPGRSVVVEPRNAPGAPPLPLDKDKGKINLIKYPGGSDYLKSAVQHAVTVGPSKSILRMGLPLLNVIDLPLVSEYGPPMF